MKIFNEKIRKGKGESEVVLDNKVENDKTEESISCLIGSDEENTINKVESLLRTRKEKIIDSMPVGASKCLVMYSFPLSDKYEKTVEEVKEEMIKMHQYIKQTNGREELIQELNKELQQYKEDTIHLPLLNEIIFIYDSVVMKINELQKSADLCNDTLKNTTDKIGIIREEILEILERHGVELLNGIGGSKYNSKIHKAIKIINTNIEKEDKEVIIVKEGFTKNGKVLRYPHVLVRKYIKEEEIENE